MSRILPLLAAGLLVLLTFPLPGAAQSLLGSGSFGVPMDALDARARAMGSIGIGHFGGQVLPGDPAGAANLQLPTISASLQPTRSSVDFDGTSAASSGSRFPLLSIGYPVGTRMVATLTFGSYLDQQWRAETERTIDLAGEDVRVLDQFSSEGGLSAIRLGVARRIAGGLSVGITGGTYTGRLTRTFVRNFEPLSIGGNVQPFRSDASWQMRAPTVAVGAQWDYQDLVRIAGSATWAGTLDMTNSAEGSDEVREMDLPTEFRLGASGVLTPRVFLNLGVGYADWTGAADAITDGGTAGTIWNYGGGIEWAGPRLLARDFPVRVGYHRAELPFQFDGHNPTESTVSGGFGINFAQIGNVSLARLDMSVERGSRDAGPFSESFWRSTFSLRLSGR